MTRRRAEGKLDSSGSATVDPEVSSSITSKNTGTLVDVSVVIGLVGLSCCFVWAFLMMATPIFLPSSHLGGFASEDAQLGFLLGCCVSLLACWRLSAICTSHRIICMVLSALCSIAGFLVAAVLEGLLFAGIAGALVGLGFGLCYVLYGDLFCKLVDHHVKTCFVTSFILSTVLCIGAFFVNDDLLPLFVIVFPVLAYALYIVVFVSTRFDKGERVVPSDVSDRRSLISWRSYVSTATSGMVFGFACGCLLSSQDARLGSAVFLIVVVSATCIIVLVDSIRSNIANETMTMRFFLPFAAVIVFPLLLVPSDLCVLFAGLLLAGSVFPTACSLSAECQHIALCKLQPMRIFSHGRLVSMGGIVLGSVIAFFGFSPIFENSMGHVPLVLSVVVFMTLVIFSASFVMTEDNYPEKERFKRVENADDDEEESLTFVAEPAVPLRCYGTDSASAAEGKQTPEPAHSDDEFQMRCSSVAQQYGLSKRQREVLVMLARGRNAEYITEQLVISAHTTKAHIYNIYQKTGVHSRQELITLVEEAGVEEKDLAEA